MNALADIRITTQDDLHGPHGDEPYSIFLSQTEYSIDHLLRINVLSARLDLKKHMSLIFRQAVKLNADEFGLGQNVVMVFKEALGCSRRCCWSAATFIGGCRTTRWGRGR